MRKRIGEIISDPLEWLLISISDIFNYFDEKRKYFKVLLLLSIFIELIMIYLYYIHNLKILNIIYADLVFILLFGFILWGRILMMMIILPMYALGYRQLKMKPLGEPPASEEQYIFSEEVIKEFYQDIRYYDSKIISLFKFVYTMYASVIGGSFYLIASNKVEFYPLIGFILISLFLLGNLSFFEIYKDVSFLKVSIRNIIKNGGHSVNTSRYYGYNLKFLNILFSALNAVTLMSSMMFISKSSFQIFGNIFLEIFSKNGLLILTSWVIFGIFYILLKVISVTIENNIEKGIDLDKSNLLAFKNPDDIWKMDCGANTYPVEEMGTQELKNLFSGIIENSIIFLITSLVISAIVLVMFKFIS